MAAPHRTGAFPHLTLAPFTLLALALSIFLEFRNNACCERWWEARRQFEQLVAEARGLVRDGMVLLLSDYALRGQLREAADDLPGERLPQAEWAQVAQARSCPDAVLRAQVAELGFLLRRGELSDNLYQLFSIGCRR